MRRLLLAIALVIGCNAQQSVTLNAPIPPALSNLNLTVVGGLGQSTYYYYIVANYPIGHVVSKGFKVANAPTTISASNYIQLNWGALAGASTYDVLRTTTANVFTAGSSGTCTTCVVVQGLTTTTYNDQSPTLSTGYTLNAPVGSSVQFYLNNRDYSTPYLFFTTVSGPTATFNFVGPTISPWTVGTNVISGGATETTISNQLQNGIGAVQVIGGPSQALLDLVDFIPYGQNIAGGSYSYVDYQGNYNGARFVDSRNTSPTGFCFDLTHLLGLALGSSCGVYFSSTVDSFGTKDTGIARHGVGIVEINGGTAGSAWTLVLGEMAVASLPTCNAGNAGTRASVNNSNAASFTAGIGAIVAAGGTTHVPVYCDGTNWRIG